MLTGVILASAAMFPLSVWLLVRNPFNIAAIASLLTWLVGVIPAIYFQQTGMIPSYAWRNFVFLGGPLSSARDSLETLVLLCTMAAAFTLGAYAAFLARKAPVPASGYLRQTSSTATFIMVALWLLSVLYFFQLSGWNSMSFFLPVKEPVRGSVYALTVFIMMPLAIVAKSYWAKGRIDRWSLLWITLSLLAVFSRDQRRDFVTAALFLLGLIVLLGDFVRNRPPRSRPISKPRGSLRFAAGLGALGLGVALVPALWYSRVFFGNLSKGAVVDPTQFRSVGDLLLGSPATGFPTLGLIRNYVQNVGADPSFIPLYLGGGIIPRIVWPEKPTTIDAKLELHYELINNPSTFWFGELYFSFGSLAVLVALALGFFMFRLADVANSSRSMLMRTLGVVLFMQSVTFFKNGVTPFVVYSLMLCSFLLFAWFFPAKKQKASAGKRIARPMSLARIENGYARRPAGSLH